MTVAELLETTSSAELGEWQAFEFAYGPLGSRYTERTLAEVVDAIERLGCTLQAVMGVDPDDIVEPTPIPRPEDIARNEDDDGEDEDEVES